MELAMLALSVVIAVVVVLWELNDGPRSRTSLEPQPSKDWPDTHPLVLHARALAYRHYSTNGALQYFIREGEIYRSISDGQWYAPVRRVSTHDRSSLPVKHLEVCDWYEAVSKDPIPRYNSALGQG